MIKREKWKSSIGFILAAAGSAIGLGNIWRFPYTVGQNGGGAFVLLYLVVVLLVGLPLMYVELSIGRNAQRGPVGAFNKLAPGSWWKLVGYLGVVTGIAILSYYGAVAGWTVWYMLKSVTGDLASVDPAKWFGQFLANGPLQVALLFGFIGLTTAVVFFGVKGGIERLSMWLMPLLFILLIILIGYAFTRENAANGLKYYLVPDPRHFTAKTFVFAVGQAFFSLSLGMGAMLTYGSYLDHKSNLLKAGASVVLFDTLIALMAGLIIFPFLGGAPEKSGAGLVFVVLTQVFQKAPGGMLLAALFFSLLTIAALTSTVSLLEVPTAHLMDEHGWSRSRATILVGVVTALIGIPSALSLGAVPSLSSMVTIAGQNMGFLDLMNFIFGNVTLALGGLLLAAFVLFRWGMKAFFKELDVKNPTLEWALKISIAVLAPIALIAMLAFILISGQSLG